VLELNVTENIKDRA